MQNGIPIFHQMLVSSVLYNVQFAFWLTEIPGRTADWPLRQRGEVYFDKSRALLHVVLSTGEGVGGCNRVPGR